VALEPVGLVLVLFVDCFLRVEGWGLEGEQNREYCWGGGALH
jgi:hypothetical protein